MDKQRAWLGWLNLSEVCACAVGVAVLQTLPELKIWAGEARWAPLGVDERPGQARGYLNKRGVI